MLIVYLQSNLARPQIPAEFGSKVPTNIRQRYLNLIIDECLKLYDDEEEAFKRVSPLFSQFTLPSWSRKVKLHLPAAGPALIKISLLESYLRN
jgi:hypothetical protein